MTKSSLIFNTLRHLRFTQVYFRIRYHLLPLKTWPRIPAGVEFVACDARFKKLVRPLSYKQRSATFMGQAHNIDFGVSWTVSADMLWLYNLHYFDDLWSVGTKDKTEFHRQIIRYWVQLNDDLSEVGWAPYPISLRIVNWCKHLWTDKSLCNDKEIIESVAIQAAVLSSKVEYHLLGNHLFANGKALIFAGVALKGSFADRLLRKGVRIVMQELDEQFLADGAHFELSPMYHNIMMWDILDLIALAYGSAREELVDLTARLTGRLERGIDWATKMRHPDGEVAFFNDSAIGVAPRIADIERYASDLGIRVNAGKLSSEVTPRVFDLKSSGYVSVRYEKYMAIVDAARIGPDYLPGHSHADTLSFELSVDDQRMIVNTGISQYETGVQRDYERSTQAHNTVVISEQSSSEVWGGFRVARRAYPANRLVSQDDKTTKVRCSHSGYMRRPINTGHTRTWSFSESSVVISDMLSGNISHGIAYFHFHPDCRVELTDDRCEVSAEEVCLVIHTAGSQASLGNYDWHAGFGQSETAVRLIVNFESRLKTRVCIQAAN